MTNERQYTLSEARRVVAIEECAGHGHDWDVVITADRRPVRLVCGRCGWSGEVNMGDRPRRP